MPRLRTCATSSSSVLSTMDAMDAQVPSNVLRVPHHRIRPYHDPTIAACQLRHKHASKQANKQTTRNSTQ